LVGGAREVDHTGSAISSKDTCVRGINKRRRRLLRRTTYKLGSGPPGWGEVETLLLLACTGLRRKIARIQLAHRVRKKRLGQGDLHLCSWVKAGGGLKASNRGSSVRSEGNRRHMQFRSLKARLSGRSRSSESLRGE